jgi:hypothetical protein
MIPWRIRPAADNADKSREHTLREQYRCERGGVKPEDRSRKQEARSKKQEAHPPLQLVFFLLLTIVSWPFWLLASDWRQLALLASCF